MPNYARTTLHITNPFNPDAEAAEFERAQTALVAFRGGITDAVLDFNAVLPMPEALHDTLLPMKVVDTAEEAEQITEGGETRIYSIDRETANAWFREYGHIDWYHWAIENWGTPRSADDVEILRDCVDVTDPRTVPELVLSFVTAQAEPHGVINHLKEQGLIVTGGVIYDDGDKFAVVGDTDLFEEYFEVNNRRINLRNEVHSDVVATKG